MRLLLSASLDDLDQGDDLIAFVEEFSGLEAKRVALGERQRRVAVVEPRADSPESRNGRSAACLRRPHQAAGPHSLGVVAVEIDPVFPSCQTPLSSFSAERENAIPVSTRHRRRR